MEKYYKTGFIHLPFNEMIKFSMPANELNDLLEDYKYYCSEKSSNILRIPLGHPSRQVLYIPANRILYIKAEEE